MLGSAAIFVTSIFMVPLLGTEFVPKADYSGDLRQLHAGLRPSPKPRRRVESIIREFPEVQYTLATINTGAQAGQDLRLGVHGGPQGPQRSVDEMAAILRNRLKQVPGITVTHAGLLDAAATSRSSSRCRAPT